MFKKNKATISKFMHLVYSTKHGVSTKYRLLMLVSALVILSAALGYYSAYKWHLAKEYKFRKHMIDNVCKQIKNNIVLTLSKNAAQLARQQGIIDTVKGKLETDKLEANKLLLNARHLLDVSLVYIMDKTGTVIACSPFGENNEKTLVGKNFKFRSYFTESQNKLNTFFHPAIGVISNKPGLYFSAPIIDKNKFLGVVVIKEDLSKVNQILAELHYPCALTTADGVIFIANDPAWLFKSATKLNQETISKIIDNRQFNNVKIKKLDLDLLAATVSYKNKTFHIHKKVVPDLNWTFCILLPHQAFTTWSTALFSMIYLVFFLSLVSIYLLYQQNHQTKKQLLLTVDKLEKSRIEQERLVQIAQKANNIKTNFLANMSHELRTPMNGICGLIQLLKLTPLVPKQWQYIDSMHKSSSMLLGIINDILDISKIESGRIILEKIDFDLKNVLYEIGSIFSHQADQKRIKFIITIDKDVPLNLCGDPFRLKQILMNLIGNGIKFTDTGEVNVNIGLISVSGNDSRLKFSVKDSGPGIPQNKLSLLFNKFSQLDVSTFRSYGGTGLGLAISKQLVEMMEGKIEVKSSENVGTEFSFIISFPVHKNSLRTTFYEQLHVDAIKSCERAYTDNSLKGNVRFKIVNHIKVLLVEDDLTSQCVISQMLEVLGIQTDIVNNGAEALNILEKNNYDLIFMDYHIPDINGYLATQIIRNPKSAIINHDVPIIAITANAIKENKERCINAGMSDYITKPVSLELIKEKIETVLKIKIDRYMEYETQPTEKLTDNNKIFNPSFLQKTMALKNHQIKRILEGFVNDIPKQIQKVKSFYQKNEFNMLKHQAHRIKGAGKNIGANEFANIAKQLEDLCPTKKRQNHGELINNLERSFMKLNNAIAPYIN